MQPSLPHCLSVQVGVQVLQTPSRQILSPPQLTPLAFLGCRQTPSLQTSLVHGLPSLSHPIPFLLVSGALTQVPLPSQVSLVQTVPSFLHSVPATRFLVTQRLVEVQTIVLQGFLAFGQGLLVLQAQTPPLRQRPVQH
jgi:hypothetical protein